MNIRTTIAIGLGLLAAAACSNEKNDTVGTQQSDPSTMQSGTGSAIPEGSSGTVANEPLDTAPSGAGGVGGVQQQPPVINQPVAGSALPPVAGSQAPIAGSEAPIAGEGSVAPIAGSEAPIAGEGSVDAGTEVIDTGERQSPCLTKPSQVVALGDSYVSLPVMLVPKIVELAIADGALQSGQTYRDYSAPGTIMGSPAAPGNIPPQLDRAIAEDSDIKVVITDGGGNDIIGSIVCLGEGSDINQACIDIVYNVVEVTRSMVDKMKAAGVTDMIYFLYPNVPLGGHDILGYAVEVGKQMCEEVNTEDFRCHLIDTRPAFDSHPEFFGIDPIHANDVGGRAIAELIWETMQSNCIGQPESSGCCTP